MQFSEAIRLGAMLRPQSFLGLYRDLDVPVFGDVLGLRAARTGSCALGAGFEALGIEVREGLGILPSDLQAFLYQRASCPECAGASVTYERLIWHLNDRHAWTREQIAAFVEPLERTPMDDDGLRWVDR